MEALSILDAPGVVLIADVCVQTRDTLIGHEHIGSALQAPNCDQRLVEPMLANDFAIEFDEDASLFHRTLRRLGLWLPAWLISLAAAHRWRHHPSRHCQSRRLAPFLRGRQFLEGRAQDRFIASPLSAVAVLLAEETSEDA